MMNINCILVVGVTVYRNCCDWYVFQRIAGCDNKKLADAPMLDGHTHLCHVVSSSNGVFSFTSIPTGKYVLVDFLLYL